MLLHDFAFVFVPAPRVCARITADGGSWLSPLATGAIHEGEALRVRIGPIASLPMLSKTVTLHVDRPIERGDITVIPLTWKATGPKGVFPVLRADLEVAPLSSDVTQLTLRGSYEPPLGLLGHGLDRLVMHRIAEAAVRSFMRRLADAVASPNGLSEHVPVPDGKRGLRTKPAAG